MDFGKLLLYVWLTAIASPGMYGSRVVFDASPHETSLLTDKLTMRCSLHDTTILVGRDVSVERQADVHQVSSIVNVQSVSSIIVMQGGQDVATLTASGPRKLSNSPSLQVSGSLATSGDERGHLLLTWSNPTNAQSGGYTCEINGIDDVGHNIALSVPAQIDYVSPSVDDLTSLVMEMKSKVSDLERRVNRSEHIETGMLRCGDSYHWAGKAGNANDYDYTDVQANFQSQYDTPPIVMLSVVEQHENNNFSVWAVDLKYVGTGSFVVRCRGWVDYIYKVLNVTWVAIPKS